MPKVPDGYVEITDGSHRLRANIDLYSNDWGVDWTPVTETDAVLISDFSDLCYRFCCPADKHPDLQCKPAETPTRSPEPTHHPVPGGHIEITDPPHRLRPGIDLFVSNSSSTSSHLDSQQWKYISELYADLISNWSGIYRFCCPADKHPELQGKPAETPTREQLQAVVRSLEQSNSDLRAEFEQWRAHADTRIGELTTDNSNLHTQLREQSQSAIKRNESDQQAFELLQAQNSDLRRLNEDLNNRLSKTLARAALATHLESKVRASGIQLLRFAVAMGDRRRWATTFVEEGVLAKAYLQAIERIDEQFTELFGEFVARFPHIQPDMPDEWQMGFDNAGNAGNADNDNEYDE